MLTVTNLIKHYGTLQAVRGISFKVPRHSCFGLLGPNGAGKTTTMEMLEGLLTPTSGEILFFGEALDQAYKERIGIQFQTTALQDYQTVRETLVLFSSLYKRRTDLGRLSRRCQLDEFLDQDTRQLSGGQRQRLLLAVALVNDPDLVFLDEPTTGLDPQSRRNFWDLIEQIRSEGTTVVLTTHYMEEAERLCDQLAIIDHGAIIAEGSPQALLADHFPAHVLRIPAAAINDPSMLSLDLRLLNNEWEIYGDNIEQLLAELRNHDVNLNQFQVSRPSLEDLFLKLTGEALRA